MDCKLQVTSYSLQVTKFIKGIFTTLVISSSVLLLSLCLILALLIWPFSRNVHYRLNCFLANAWGEWCVWWARVVCGVRIKVRSDPPSSLENSRDYGVAKENAIVIANHQCMADLVVFLTFAARRERIGDTKSFAKNSMKYWPGLGWALVLLGFIIVKRDWKKDESSVRRAYSRILERDAPFWLVIFPEATRLTQTKLRRSQEYARQNQLPVLQRVLLPRTHGFVSAVRTLREKVDVVYDLTIDYGKVVPSLWQVACGAQRTVRLDVRKISMSGLPVKEDEIKAWLYQRFAEKDQILWNSTIKKRGSV